MCDTSGLLKGAGESTNYWDIMVFSGVTTALGVSTVGGITALATDIECDVARFDTVAVCCAREAPPPLIPIVALVCAVVMFGMVWIRRLNVKTFQAFRSKVHVAAEEYAKEDEEAKRKALKKRIFNMLPHSAETVSSTTRVLKCWACWQMIMAFSLLAITCLVLGLVLGSAVIIGGKEGMYMNPIKHESYYDFECPSSCSIFTASPTAVPTAAPTASPTLPTPAPTATPTILGAPTTAQPTQQPTFALNTTLPPSELGVIPCRIKPESLGLFWTLVGALLLCVAGSCRFAYFIFGLGVHTDDPELALSDELEKELKKDLNETEGSQSKARKPRLRKSRAGAKSDDHPKEEPDPPQKDGRSGCCGYCGSKDADIGDNEANHPKESPQKDGRSGCCGDCGSKDAEPHRARWETDVLFDYATGDERDLSLRVFRNDMKLFVEETFAEDFEPLREGLQTTTDNVKKKLTTLAQLYKVWADKLSDPNNGPLVDFSTEFHRKRYNDFMKRLRPAEATLVRMNRLIDLFDGDPKTALKWNNRRVHDGKRIVILRKLKKTLEKLKPDITKMDKDWNDNVDKTPLWSSAAIRTHPMTMSIENFDAMKYGPADAPDFIPA
eukprot:m.237338 g.237338  ORF g.237338 m.237338 type:complete len:610 (-) comp15792_c0_seq4:1848-3677(-)